MRKHRTAAYAAKQWRRSETRVAGLRRAIAARDVATARAIGQRLNNCSDMRKLLWRSVGNDARALGFVASSWDGINGWYR